MYRGIIIDHIEYDDIYNWEAYLGGICYRSADMAWLIKTIDAYLDNPGGYDDAES